MADRYWVGGTAAWDATAGTKWALTSGGAGGQAVPTAADDVYFDAASGAVTCTISAGNTGAKSINCTGFTGTLAGFTAITVFGSITLVVAMGFTYSGNFIINATSTITSAGKTFPRIDINAGAVVTLGDALTQSSSASLNLAQGTFNTNNYNVTTAEFSSNNSNVRTINLGSSIFTCTGGSGGFRLSSNTNLTFNAGTSTIVLTGPSQSIDGGAAGSTGLTFYNVSITNTSATNTFFQSKNTFNNITVTGPASAGVRFVSFTDPQTINGTLSTTGTAGNRRVWFQSATYGIAQTLVINSAPSLVDADFRDIYIVGTAAPISGTRIGNLRGCSGITFSTPKTVYWTTATNSTFSGNNWATTIGGAVSTDNFPLAQDTATFTNTGLNVSATASLDGVIPYIGSVNMSARTNAMTLNITAAIAIYGNWTNGSGTTIFNTGALTFSGRNTQTITSAGKTFSGNITADSYGGSVELADALNIGSNAITVTNGTFNTKNFSVSAGEFSSNNSNVRTINLGSSTVTLSSLSTITFTTSTNLTFNAGTSLINLNLTGPIINGGGVTFYNVAAVSILTGFNLSISQVNTFNNLTLSTPASTGFVYLDLVNDQNIVGTLTVSGASPVRRIMVRPTSLGTQRNLTVGTLAATDCDFRDIRILGTAVGSTPVRAGDCGGNSGITFPAPKTVYWNLAGAQNWSATAWAASSGGTPDINNFPLAQDTAVFDNAGSVTGIISINAAWNIGSFNASARTSAMTFNLSACQIYGNWTHGTGVTFSAQNAGVAFCRNGGTQTITSNGVSFGANRLQPSAVNGGKVVLADAFTSAAPIQFTSGEFDAAGFNLTCQAFEGNNTTPIRVLRMGGGLWTLTGPNSPWVVNPGSTLTFYKSTSDILLSDNSTTARFFSGFGLSYNKLTIGGTTGTSTTTIDSNNQFTELASTKTVAHTIALGTTTQTFGKWTVTGTVGNVVTVTGTGTNHVIAGARVSGVDYLAMGTIGFAATSPGEFYAGANSTGTNATIIKTAAPAAVTRYWVGGTGTWDATTTTKWSDTSGGAGGASVPTSADAVVFDAMSNATAYTVTCTATQLRCGSLTMAGPLTGNVTWAGLAPLAFHDNVSLAATGITRTYSGALTLSGSTTGKTFTTNGVVLSNAITVNGVGCEWTLGSAINIGGNFFQLINGTLASANYSITGSGFGVSEHSTTFTLGSSSCTFSNAGPIYHLSGGSSKSLNFTFNSGTSSITFSGLNTLGWNSPITFYNVTLTNTSPGTITFSNANETYNNLTIAKPANPAMQIFVLRGNMNVNNTLTLPAGTDATRRHFVQSNTINTTRTLTCAAVSATDVDFRDIAIVGTAAPVSGTRLGDCKGNSGIVFDAAKTVYWNLAGNNDWSATAWATSAGGTPAANNFPLAQDTAVFTSTSPSTGATTTINANYNIGTIDMSARTSNTMTLATGSTAPFIYGNWINGTGTTLTGTGTMTFAGRGGQAITSSGKTFAQQFTIDCRSGSVTLQDAFNSSNASGNALRIDSGTFSANGYNLTMSGSTSGINTGATTTPKMSDIGSGTWTIAGSNGWAANATTTITGTGTISLTNASAKTFAGGGVSYSGITLNQGGLGTLTITGNNTFGNITNTYAATGATTIALGTTTQRVAAFGASGQAGRVLTVTGTSASSPATLIFTGSGQATTPTTDYLAITGVRAYSLTDTWSAGANSVNNGSLGWLFAAATAAVVSAAGRFFLFF